MRRFLAAIGRHIPARIVEIVGRRTGDNRLFSLADRVARFAFSGHVVIPRGAGQGLSFNADGERPGFGLGTWEPQVQRALVELLAEGQVVYDIGAASGFYSLIAARRVIPDGKVVAFEPIPESAARLRGNVSLNGFENVTVIELALGDHLGRAVMVEGDERDQAMTIAIPAASGLGGVEVPVATIDELVAGGTIPPPDVVKMDVEGAEVAVLRGAAKTLRENAPVLLIEVHGQWDELIPLLESHQYRYGGVESSQPELATCPTHVIARHSIDLVPRGST
jgi:FkbM family methyltransferase